MRPRPDRTRLIFLLPLIAIACSSEMPMEEDAGVIDTGQEVDAGTRMMCPDQAAPACTSPVDCEANQSPPSNCTFCPEYNKQLCRLGACDTPEALGNGDVYEVIFDVASLVNDLNSFAAGAYIAETSGGISITCQQVYDGTVDLQNACINPVDSRGRNITPPKTNTYSILFSRFPSGQRTLFVVWGFEEDGAVGDPIGISCTEYDVGSPIGAEVEVSGDMMRRIP